MSDTRKVSLVSCLPDYLKEIRELKEIARLENTELQGLYDKCGELWKDGFIRTAGYQGIKKWESILGIKGKGTLEDRREAVLIRWSKKLPYTMQVLLDLLYLWGGTDGFTVDASGFSDYEIRIAIKNQTLPVLHGIKEEIKAMLPANLILYFCGRYLEEYRVKVRCQNEIHVQTGFYPRYNQAFLYLDHMWKLDGNQKLNGHHTELLSDFYPISACLTAPVEEETGTSQDLGLFLNVSGGVDLWQNCRLKTETGTSPKTKEGLLIQASATVRAASQHTEATNLNVLDHQWRLDRSRKLNGGKTIL